VTALTWRPIPNIFCLVSSETRRGSSSVCLRLTLCIFPLPFVRRQGRGMTLQSPLSWGFERWYRASRWSMVEAPVLQEAKTLLSHVHDFAGYDALLRLSL